ELPNKSPPPQARDYKFANVKMVADFRNWSDKVRKFATVGGYPFDSDIYQILHVPGCVFAVLDQISGPSPQHLCEPPKRLSGVLADISFKCAVIDRVPIDLEARLFEERTPFTTYMAINDVVRAAKQRLHVIDPSLDADFFPLYLRNLDKAVQVRLVTTSGKAYYGVQNVLAVAKRAAGEFTDFQLIE